MRLQIVFILLTLSNLTAQTAFVTGSGYVAPPSIVVAPGQIATFFVGGLEQTASALQNTVAQVVSGSVTQAATVISAKPVDASTLAVTVQMPFTILPGTTASIQFGQAAEGAIGPLRSEHLHCTGNPQRDAGAGACYHYLRRFLCDADDHVPVGGHPSGRKHRDQCSASQRWRGFDDLGARFGRPR